MPRSRKAAAKTSVSVDLTEPQYYFNRELSWLEFNNRVLHEAFDPRTPLLERLRFMSVFCANLDEFFMLRVAELKQQIEDDIEDDIVRLGPDGHSPEAQLHLIAERLRPMVAQHHRHFEQALRSQLAAKGVELLNYSDLKPEQQQYLSQYFESNIFPVLTPLAIDPSHPFPYISNLSLNLAVVVRDSETEQRRLARVKVPKLLPRFVVLPDSLYPVRKQAVVWAGVPLEQIIAHHLAALFPGMSIEEYYAFRITRNAEIEVEEADDLLREVEQKLRRRWIGATAVRLEIQADAPPRIRAMLLRELELNADDLYEISGMLCLRDLEILADLSLPELKYLAWNGVIPAALRRANQRFNHAHQNPEPEEDVFSAIRRSDILLHHPYDSFAASVQLLINQAAVDPAVLAIKLTLYRTSADSQILSALIAAAENGKQVSVLVELQARFDEANNINWARRLERTGVHVVYGLVGLKTHAKVALVVRQEGEEIQRYVHIGTGDYNPKTARRYTDLGLLSCRPELGADLSELFNYLTGYSRQTRYRKLLVAPVNLRDQLIGLIRREAKLAQQGHHARIVAKVGAVTDPQLIKTLYEASQAGVKIDLIIQSVCCLRPGIAGVSDSINVISVVGRFLEHSRIFYFHNQGAAETYLGSADWMRRNLDRRVEVLVPIADAQLAKDLQEILGTLLADNRHAWELQFSGRYIQRHARTKEAEVNATDVFMELARQK